MAVFEAVWSLRPAITPLRAKTEEIWRACQHRLTVTALFPTVEDMLGNCSVCADCPEVVCPRRDCPVTTCPPPPSCQKCPEVATISPIFPPRFFPPPPTSDDSLVLIVGSAAVGAVVAILATLLIVWLTTSRPTTRRNEDEAARSETGPLTDILSEVGMS